MNIYSLSPLFDILQAWGGSSYDPASHQWASVCAPVVLNDAIRNGCGLDTTQASQYHARCSFATHGTISTFWNLTVHVRQGWTIWPSKEVLHVKMTLEVMKWTTWWVQNMHLFVDFNVMTFDQWFVLCLFIQTTHQNFPDILGQNTNVTIQFILSISSLSFLNERTSQFFGNMFVMCKYWHEIWICLFSPCGLDNFGA